MTAVVASAAIGICVAAVLAMMTGYGPDRLFAPMRPVDDTTGFVRQPLDEAPRLTPIQRLAFSLLAGGFAFLLIAGVFRVIALALPVALVAGIGGPSLYVEQQRRRWRRQRLRAWPEAIRELASGILSARSLHQSLVGLGATGPETLRPMWQRYAALSQSLDPKLALEAVRDDLADPVTDRVLEVLILAFDAGPAVTLDIMRDLSDSIGEDLHLVRRIDVANSEERLTAWMTVLLPMAMLLVVVLLGGDEIRRFYESTAGFAVVAVGTAISTVSFIIVSRLAKTTVEPRLFTRDEQS